MLCCFSEETLFSLMGPKLQRKVCHFPFVLVTKIVVLPQPLYETLCLLLSICVVETVCACALWTSCMVQTLKFKTMQCTAGTDSMYTAWDKLRVPLAHVLYLFLGIFGCSLSITQLYVGPLLVLWLRGQATRTTRNSSQRKICGTKCCKRAKK